jgi:hypothetical protein
MPQGDTRSEASLERALCTVVQKCGGLCLKMPADLYLGIPDRLVLLPGGWAMFVELKRLTGKLSEPQVRYIRKLRKLGHNVKVVRGSTAVNNLIKEIKQWSLSIP